MKVGVHLVQVVVCSFFQLSIVEFETRKTVDLFATGCSAPATRKAGRLVFVGSCDTASSGRQQNSCWVTQTWSVRSFFDSPATRIKSPGSGVEREVTSGHLSISSTMHLPGVEMGSQRKEQNGERIARIE